MLLPLPVRPLALLLRRFDEPGSETIFNVLFCLVRCSPGDNLGRERIFGNDLAVVSSRRALKRLQELTISKDASTTY